MDKGDSCLIFTAKFVVAHHIALNLNPNFIRLLRVVFFSQQRLNRPAVNAVQ